MVFNRSRRSYYLFLTTCSYYLLVVVKTRRFWGSVVVKTRRSGVFSRGENSWKTPRNHNGLWKRPSRASDGCAAGRTGREKCPARVRHSWVLLTGLRRGTAFPAFGVTETNAFLARRIGVVHHCGLVEEDPTQREGCPLGSIPAWVLDVGFRLCHESAALSGPPLVTPGRSSAT